MNQKHSPQAETLTYLIIRATKQPRQTLPKAADAPAVQSTREKPTHIFGLSRVVTNDEPASS